MILLHNPVFTTWHAWATVFFSTRGSCGTLVFGFFPSLPGRQQIEHSFMLSVQIADVNPPPFLRNTIAFQTSPLRSLPSYLNQRAQMNRSSLFRNLQDLIEEFSISETQCYLINVQCQTNISQSRCSRHDVLLVRLNWRTFSPLGLPAFAESSGENFQSVISGSA